MSTNKVTRTKWTDLLQIHSSTEFDGRKNNWEYERTKCKQQFYQIQSIPSKDSFSWLQNSVALTYGSQVLIDLLCGQYSKDWILHPHDSNLKVFITTK